MDNIIDQKSKAFAVRIVKFTRYLQEEKKEFVLSKQILRFTQNDKKRLLKVFLIVPTISERIVNIAR